jgi:hypothetical protein
VAEVSAQEAAPLDTGHRYVLEARLDEVAHVVEGVARIRFQNKSRAEVDALYLHLYLNAFASEDTVFMRGTTGVSRGNESTGEGSITLSSLEDADGHDLLSGADDALVPDDHTQMRVPLATALAPGDHVELVAHFRSVLPPVFARTGYHGSFHTVAQWFPKIARHEEDGTWRSFPYHPYGEFHADFARYELTIDVPEAFVVGATGHLIESHRHDDRTVYRYVADEVHDAVFVAWDRFEESRFDAEGVAVRILFPPGYEPSVELHRTTVEAGLAHFGRLLGDYPYDDLTVVVPPRGAEGAAGMEYPTLFLTAGPPYPMRFAPLAGQAHVTAHELGHQWFQGIIASDEDRFPFLDEGLTQYITGDLLRRMHGPNRSGFSWPFAIDFFQVMRVASYSGLHDRPPAFEAARFHGQEYGRSVYARTSVVLETVRRTFGRRRFDRTLGDYARRHRFAHPTPDDLYAAFDRHYDPGFSRRVLRPALEDGESADLSIFNLSSRARDDGDGHRNDVLVLRRGGVALPTWVELRYADGTRRRVPFPQNDDTLRVTERGAPELVGARVDPDGHDLLDPTFADRSRRLPRRASLFGVLLHAIGQLGAWVGP